MPWDFDCLYQETIIYRLTHHTITKVISMLTQPTVNSESMTEPISKEKKSFNFPICIVFAAFIMLLLGSFFNWASDYDGAPNGDDFVDDNEYQEAVVEHNEKIHRFEGFSILMFTSGPIMLAAGLFFVSTRSSHDLPNWVRVALMAGTMFFIIKLFTTELSIFELAQLGYYDL